MGCRCSAFVLDAHAVQLVAVPGSLDPATPAHYRLRLRFLGVSSSSSPFHAITLHASPPLPCLLPTLPPLPTPTQIGDVLLDVNPGIPPGFRQDVAVVSAQAKRCVMLGQVRLRMVASPNVDTLLDADQPLPAWPRTGAAVAAGGGGKAAVGGRRAIVDDDESSEEVEEMDVDGEGAAANGAQQGPAAGQQGKQQQQREGKQLAAVAIKSEAGEEEEVVSPRRGGGGLRSPRGRKADGGGGGS